MKSTLRSWRQHRATPGHATLQHAATQNPSLTAVQLQFDILRKSNTPQPRPGNQRGHRPITQESSWPEWRWPDRLSETAVPVRSFTEPLWWQWIWGHDDNTVLQPNLINYLTISSKMLHDPSVLNLWHHSNLPVTYFYSFKNDTSIYT